jgi:hypothetical protein
MASEILSETQLSQEVIKLSETQLSAEVIKHIKYLESQWPNSRTNYLRSPNIELNFVLESLTLQKLPEFICKFERSESSEFLKTIIEIIDALFEVQPQFQGKNQVFHRNMIRKKLDEVLPNGGLRTLVTSLIEILKKQKNSFTTATLLVEVAAIEAPKLLIIIIFFMKIAYANIKRGYDIDNDVLVFDYMKVVRKDILEMSSKVDKCFMKNAFSAKVSIPELIEPVVLLPEVSELVGLLAQQATKADLLNFYTSVNLSFKLFRMFEAKKAHEKALKMRNEEEGHATSKVAEMLADRGYNTAAQMLNSAKTKRIKGELDKIALPSKIDRGVYQSVTRKLFSKKYDYAVQLNAAISEEFPKANMSDPAVLEKIQVFATNWAAKLKETEPPQYHIDIDKVAEDKIKSISDLSLEKLRGSSRTAARSKTEPSAVKPKKGYFWGHYGGTKRNRKARPKRQLQSRRRR